MKRDTDYRLRGDQEAQVTERIPAVITPEEGPEVRDRRWWRERERERERGLPVSA